VEQDANSLRTQFLKQTEHSLFGLIISRLDVDLETAVINLLTDVVRHVCDVTNLEEGTEKSLFLNLFYQKYASILFTPLTRQVPHNGHHSEVEGLLKNNLCELLSSFVKQHTQWISTFLMGNNLVLSLLNLLNCKDKWLLLSAIRFFRMFIDVDNNNFKNYIISENLFEPIIQVFLNNGPKYNILNSAVLELFEWILKRNMKIIIRHIMEKHYDKLKDIIYTEIFHKLKDQFEKNEHEPPIPEHTVENIAVRQNNRFVGERKEEAWFDSDEYEDYNPEREFLSTAIMELRNKKRNRIEGEEEIGDGSPTKKLKKIKHWKDKRKSIN